MKSLIIDDDPLSIVILSKILLSLGIDSEGCNSISSAEDILKTLIPDVIFLDLFFSKENGIQFLNEILNDPVLSDIPVVITSGSSHLETISKCLKQGASSYLIKPIQNDLLKLELNKVGVLMK